MVCGTTLTREDAVAERTNGEWTPPLVLVHGFPLSAAMWAPVRPYLESRSWVVTPDLPGFGGTPPLPGPVSMEALADWVADLADDLAIDRFVLGGHSMGGYVALALAARRPERLAGLVLVDTRATADTPEAADRRRAAAADIGLHGGAPFRESFLPNLVGETTRRTRPEVVAGMHALAEAVSDRVLVACLEGMRQRPDRSGLLARLDLPALVLVGEEDVVTPPAESAAMARAMPQAEMVVIPGAGHTPSLEQPEATGRALSRWLGAALPLER